MTLLYILAVLIVLTPTVRLFNVTKVVELYDAAIGPSICNLSRFPGFADKQRLSRYDAGYSKCYCDIKCFSIGDCCPDMFFSYQQSCIRTSILNLNPRKNDTFVYMIDKCPPESDHGIKELCENVSNDILGQLENFPVTSRSSFLSYRNIQCSQCHNENSENIVSWKIGMDCSEFADFNFASTFKEIIDIATERKCNIHYVKPHLRIRECFVIDNPQTTIQTCNVSGTWTQYEPDVEFACKHYNNYYPKRTYSWQFKNVFCYLCNPPRALGNVISKCNATGLWRQFDSSLEEACLTTKMSTAVLPFKNIYCYRCNGIKIDKRKEIKFKFNDNLPFAVIYPESRTYTIGSIRTNLNLTTSRVGQENKFSPHMLSNKINISTQINMTNLYRTYSAFTGLRNVCVNESNRYCDCSEDCHFDRRGCCIDAAFKKSTVCSESKYSADGRSRYLLYNKCLDTRNPMLNKLCQSNSEGNLSSFQPVTLQKHDHKFDVHYKNVYCALCSAADVKSKLVTWTLTLKCPVYLPTFTNVNSEDYFEFAIKNDCKPRYMPSFNVRKHTLCQTKYNRCNVTGMWNHYDSDVEFACENWLTHPLGNIFCLICNPENTLEILYKTCNETGYWKTYDKSIDDNCLNMPEINNFSPYKNRYCKTCNERRRKADTDIRMPWESDKHGVSGGGDELIGGVDAGGVPTFRAMFSPPKRENVDDKTITQIQCNNSQTSLPDTDECRNIYCYPGRRYRNGSCQVLLQETMNLGYIFFAGIKGTLNISMNTTRDFLKSVDNSFNLFVRTRLMLSSIFIESSFLISNLKCRKGVIWNAGSDVIISIYQTFFVDENVNRSMFEENLLKLSNIEFNVTYEGTVHNFTTYYNKESLRVPQIINKYGFTDKCISNKVNSYDKRGPDPHMYVHSYISKLLTCQQIELKPNEFVVDLNSLNLTILSTNFQLGPDEYILTKSKRSRICLDGLRNLTVKPDKEEYKTNVWELILAICTTASLFCLLISFLTYCLFQNLRKTPGINNICLIFAMFCANSLFQFGLFQTHSDILCTIIGVCLHYFWLATFGCLNVCSFHMYHVFKCKMYRSNSPRKCRIAFYMLYSYGLPAFIVFLNSLVTAITTEYSSIGYGGTVCFINQQISYFVTFITPVTFVCITNIFFFVGTSIALGNRPKVRTDAPMHSNRNFAVVYAKLFSITGISWMLQIIDSFMPMSIFSTIVSLLNSVQGVFIFVSFICNKHVWCLYVQSVSKSRENSSKRSETRKKTRPAILIRNLE